MSALCSGLPGKVDRKMHHAASAISARCVAHCSALHLPSHRVPFFLPFPSVASPAAFSVSLKSSSPWLSVRQGGRPFRPLCLNLSLSSCLWHCRAISFHQYCDEKAM